MCSLKEPIDSSAALKSLKMWSPPGYAAKAMEAMGVPVVAGPATEMYALISKGTVDGFNGVSTGDAAFKTAQLAKSCTVVEGGVFTPIFAVMINQGVWDGLPAEDQKAIESVSGEAFARLSGAVDEWNAANLKAYTDQGGTLVTPSATFQDEMKAAWAPMGAAWVAKANSAGLDGQAIFDFYQEQVKAVEAE
ncbi:MAG: TRAP transporter substrate-binding protein DctP [Nitratireductor sp.]